LDRYKSIVHCYPGSLNNNGFYVLTNRKYLSLIILNINRACAEQYYYAKVFFSFRDIITIEIIYFSQMKVSFSLCMTPICNIFRADNTILHETYCSTSTGTNDVKRIR